MDQFGAYIHIPFCIQRCHYCDFATYGKDQWPSQEEYLQALSKEIRLRSSLFKERHLNTLYFGGGTPSLLSAKQIGGIITDFLKNGFVINSETEITLEVNPATMDAEKCKAFGAEGVNRVSIGCQSFNDEYLKACGREHSADDTRRTIEMVSQYFRNYSLDLLFSLPKQGKTALAKDLHEIQFWNPPHVSGYCLTLPERHPMNEGRCSEDEQVGMFKMVIEALQQIGLTRYELSNFAKPGFESRHNNLYWTDQNYWGVGLSAHSYRRYPDQGYRFWNPRGFAAYIQQMASLTEQRDIEETFPKGQWEKLKLHESFTDYCHTQLRMGQGLNIRSARQKYGEWAEPLIRSRLATSKQRGLIIEGQESLALTDPGFLLSNQVFQELLFSREDIDKAQAGHLF